MMLYSKQTAQLAGIESVDAFEIEKYRKRLLAEKEAFFVRLVDWVNNNIIQVDDTFLNENYFDSLISTDYGSEFYHIQYRQALKWLELELSPCHITLINNRFRQEFIELSTELGSVKLGRSLCLLADFSLSIALSLYDLDESILKMKEKTENEVNRINKLFGLVSYAVPEALLNSYIAHQEWKKTVFSLSLAQPVEIDKFELSYEKCQLAQWLKTGGSERIPKEKRETFNLEHEKMHFLGKQAIENAKNDLPEEIINSLSAMEYSADYVSQTILDIIEDDFVRLATSDSLTNLPNRRSFDIAFKKQGSLAKRHELWLGLVLIDIDLFKKINDTYGHFVGDEILKEIALLLKNSAREEEQVFRWGGEEFAIISVNKHTCEAEKLAERFRKIVERHVFNQPEHKFSLTVSCGVINIGSKSKLPINEIFQLADAQLYKAKEGGRNTVKSVICEN